MVFFIHDDEALNRLLKDLTKGDADEIMTWKAKAEQYDVLKESINIWQEKAKKWDELLINIFHIHESSDSKVVFDWTRELLDKAKKWDEIGRDKIFDQIISTWREKAEKWDEFQRVEPHGAPDLRMILEWKEKAKKWDEFSNAYPDVSKWKEKAEKWDKSVCEICKQVGINNPDKFIVHDNCLRRLMEFYFRWFKSMH